MEKRIKASYTLSDGNGIIYISKNHFYDLFHDGKTHYIFDNSGSRMNLNQETLRGRFEFQS